jgi:hypothetical protein
VFTDIPTPKASPLQKRNREAEEFINNGENGLLFALFREYLFQILCFKKGAEMGKMRKTFYGFSSSPDEDSSISVVVGVFMPSRQAG